MEGLDASRFAPFTSDEAKEFAKTHRSLVRASWESQDRIPSPELPRTQLIDRAMVGLGFISPEELAEAHELGTRYDQAQGDARWVREQADIEARRSLEERQALKEQKREEAARRRQERAQQIALRRETDIVFLGRGVSRGLADRRANVEKLESRGLPLMATPADLATALGITIPRLRWLAFHSEASRVTHYIRFTVPKKSGGRRVLSTPHKAMSECQEWIFHNVLAKVPPHPSAHGFVSGRSTVTNAVPHVGKDVVVNVDLKDFFPSVTFPRVKGMFQGMGYSPAVSTILALLCTESPRRKVRYGKETYHVATAVRSLPQGACTSPGLSNLVVRRLDARLDGLCKKLGWSYTRYADDMTFSAKGNKSDEIGYLLARVRHLVQEEGFVLNNRKTRILKRNAAQTVTGIVVNDRPGVPRREVRRMRAILHQARVDGLKAQNREHIPHFESWLQGMVAYIHMVNPKQGGKLKADLDRLSP